MLLISWCVGFFFVSLCSACPSYLHGGKETVLSNFTDHKNPDGRLLSMVTLDDPVVSFRVDESLHACKQLSPHRIYQNETFGYNSDNDNKRYLLPTQMGGKSKSTCRQVDDSYLVWEGTVEMVEALKTPGFCTLRSEARQFMSGLLKDTMSISFYVTKDSHFFRPMGITLENALHTQGPLPIAYWAPALEQQVTPDIIRLSSLWSEFTPKAFGQKVPAPALDSEGLASTTRIGLTTYLAQTTGSFSLQILSITAAVHSMNSMNSTAESGV